MKRITWLSSYPKSGNTWTRIFLNNLKSKENNEAVSFNELNEIDFAHASGRHFADRALGYSASLHTHAELRQLQADTYRHFASKWRKNFTLKNHDAYTYTKGEADFPADVSRGAIYILRNPLEVACSYANHNSKSIEQTIEMMNDPNHGLAFNKNKPQNQLPQPMGTWSQHVQSWIKVKDFPVLVIRYEDLHAEPLVNFTAIAKFLDLPSDPENIKRAIDLSAFEKVQKQEEKEDFKEKPAHTEKFFRQGKVDGWKEQLSQKQIDSIITAHRETMLQFNYIEDQNIPL